MALVLVTAPSVEPLTASETWQHLRVPLTGSPEAPADATLIANLLTAARQTLDGKDGWLGRCLCQQTWDLKLDAFPRGRNVQSGYRGTLAAADCIEVPLPPLRSVTSITYVDQDGTTQTLSSTLYTVDSSSEPARITPAYGEVWPSTRDQVNAVTVRFVAGYDPGSPADYRANVPWGIKFGLLQILTDMYETRQTLQPMQAYEVPEGVQRYLSQYRMWEFF